MNQLIPARGRKQVCSVALDHDTVNQLIPARGRKPYHPQAALLRSSRINSSPQGDGNQEHPANWLIFMTNQLIPARGRKPQPPLLIDQPRSESTHPRKGTETINAQIDNLTEYCLLYTSPMRLTPILKQKTFRLSVTSKMKFTITMLQMLQNMTMK